MRISAIIILALALVSGGIVSFVMASQPPVIDTPAVASVFSRGPLTLQGSHGTDPVTWSTSGASVDPCTGEVAGLPSEGTLDIVATLTTQDCNVPVESSTKAIKVLIDPTDEAGYCDVYTPGAPPTSNCHFSRWIGNPEGPYDMTPAGDNDPHSATWLNGVRTLNGPDGYHAINFPDPGEFHNMRFLTGPPVFVDNQVTNLVDDTVIANSARFLGATKPTPFVEGFALSDLLELEAALNTPDGVLYFVCTLHDTAMTSYVKVR